MRRKPQQLFASPIAGRSRGKGLGLQLRITAGLRTGLLESLAVAFEAESHGVWPLLSTQVR